LTVFYLFFVSGNCTSHFIITSREGAIFIWVSVLLIHDKRFNPKIDNY